MTRKNSLSVRELALKDIAKVAPTIYVDSTEAIKKNKELKIPVHKPKK